jgi:hypothetical protein
MRVVESYGEATEDFATEHAHRVFGAAATGYFYVAHKVWPDLKSPQLGDAACRRRS